MKLSFLWFYDSDGWDLPSREESVYPFKGVSTLYKALGREQFDRFRRVGVPGFIGSFGVAMMYAEYGCPGVIISMSVDLGLVRDLSRY